MIPGQILIPLVRLPRDPGACWQWMGATTGDGYPNKTINGKSISGRRWLWQTLFGPLPDSLVLRMTCASRDCVSPHHMEVVAMADAQREGANTVLLPGDVAEIRRARRIRGPGVACALAQRFHCSERTIYDIWARRSWRATSPESARRAAAQRPAGESRAKVLELVQLRMMSVKEIGAATGLTTPAVRRHLKLLIAEGRVQYLKHHRKFKAPPSPAAPLARAA